MELKEIMAGLKKLEPTIGAFQGLYVRPDGDATATFQEYPLGFEDIEELEELAGTLLMERNHRGTEARRTERFYPARAGQRRERSRRERSNYERAHGD